MTMVYLSVGLLVLMVIGLVVRRATDEPIPRDITDAQIVDLARQGKRIQAIKWYRQLHDASLREAKDAVEAMLK